MSEFYAESWTNAIGQKLLPGDRVIAIASGWGHNTSTRVATYLGVRKDSKGRVEGVSVEYDGPQYTWSSQKLKSFLPRKRVYRITE